MDGKMAAEVRQEIQSELNNISSTKDQSGNMRKDLKKIIFESVSKLRNLFTKTIDMHDESIRQNKELENAVNMAKAELCTRRSAVAMGHANIW
jgi:hypothetical protein